MKYKYLKGSEKDFEGASEWATYLVSVMDGRYCAWVSHGDNKYQYRTDADGNVGREIIGIFIKYDWKCGVEIIAERQPITEPSWDGVGLPPVGCECEMHNAIGEFIPVDIISNHAGFAFGWNYDRRIVYFSDKPCEFRPRRSEADKRRSAAIGAMEREWEGVTNVPAVEFELIYDLISAGKIPGVKLED